MVSDKYFLMNKSVCGAWREIKENHINGNGNWTLSPHPTCIASIFSRHASNIPALSTTLGSAQRQRIAALFILRTLVMLQRQHQLPLLRTIKDTQEKMIYTAEQRKWELTCGNDPDVSNASTTVMSSETRLKFTRFVRHQAVLCHLTKHVRSYL